MPRAILRQIRNGTKNSRAFFCSPCLFNSEITFEMCQVVCEHLVGMLLVVCAKKILVPHIKDIETSVAGVGVMGVMVGGFLIH